jgi:hypothetical protein
MGRSGMLIGLWWEFQKERIYLEDLDVGTRIIIKWVIEK